MVVRLLRGFLSRLLAGPPADAVSMHWVDERLSWLIDEFGRDTLIRPAIVTPSEDFFPDVQGGGRDDVMTIVKSVCRRMDVPRGRIWVEFFDERQELFLMNERGHYIGTVAAGTYQQEMNRAIIRVNMAEAFNVADIVGTVAHELSHVRLMGEGRLSGDEFDNELTTDLTAVFFGYGIFLGNSPRNWPGDDTHWPGTTLRRPEYMSLPMYGYALARIAEMRGDVDPEWSSWMNADLRSNFRQASRYLRMQSTSRER